MLVSSSVNVSTIKPSGRACSTPASSRADSPNHTRTTFGNGNSRRPLPVPTRPNVIVGKPPNSCAIEVSSTAPVGVTSSFSTSST